MPSFSLHPNEMDQSGDFATNSQPYFNWSIAAVKYYYALKLKVSTVVSSVASSSLPLQISAASSSLPLQVSAASSSLPLHVSAASSLPLHVSAASSLPLHVSAAASVNLASAFYLPLLIFLISPTLVFVENHDQQRYVTHDMNCLFVAIWRQRMYLRFCCRVLLSWD